MSAPPLESAPLRSPLGSWLVGALAVAALVLAIAQVAWPWMVDDAFISLRYAERFAEGRGLTWNDGERVEGYSNLLWVLATAALCRLGIDGVTAVRALGILCTVATFVVLLASRVLPASIPARLAVVVLASLATTATWSVAGLEAPLVMLLLALAFADVQRALAADSGEHRALGRAGIAFALLACTRPDAPLWLGVAVLVLLLHRPQLGARGLAILLAPPALMIAAQLVFRLAYYGDWLPNTAYAKLGSSAASRSAGVDYLGANAVALRALLVPAALAVGAFAARRARGVVGLAALGACAWCGYVALVGGDAFPRGRLLVPALVPLTVLAAHGIAWLAHGGRARRAAACALAIACVALASFDARRATSDPGQQLSTWERLGEVTGAWLARAFRGAQPLLAVDAAGAVPYASRLPCLDMLGLCDRTIARTPFPDGAGFVAGHNRANGAYVLAREPDLVLFGTPPGTPRPKWLGGRQMEDDARFLADWRVVRFDAGDVQAATGAMPMRIIVWARLPGRLGLRPDPAMPSRTLLPGFWLCSWRQPYSFTRAEREPAVFDRAQAVRDVQAGAMWLLSSDAVAVAVDGAELPVAEVRRAGSYVVSRLRLPTGRHRVGSADLPAGARLTLQSSDGSALAHDAGAWLVPEAAASAGVDLVLAVDAAAPLPFRIRYFAFEAVE